MEEDVAHQETCPKKAHAKGSPQAPPQKPYTKPPPKALLMREAVAHQPLP